jgi:uncharacterized protein (TIGR02145 family)
LYPHRFNYEKCNLIPYIRKNEMKMKTIFTLLLAALALAATGQPQKIHYQAVAVGANGKPIKNSTVGLRLSVLDSFPTGTTLYTETQTASTDASGQFSIYLGAGTATTGTFANLPWANGNDKFLKVEMDAQGGSNYQPMGTTQLVSVPYAMAAGTASQLSIPGNNGEMYSLTVGVNGPTWGCFPKLPFAFAGSDQIKISNNNIDTILLSGNSPESGNNGSWRILLGAGGNIVSPNDSMTFFIGAVPEMYLLEWTITGPCGFTKDSVFLNFRRPCGQAVTYAGESYPTVQIGTQCWFAKNLNVGTMITGTSDQTNNGTIEKYCYNNSPANCTTYGGLYQWAEAVQYQNGASNSTSPNPAFTGNVRGICPTGWHLPSDAEYCTLTTFLDATVNCGTFGWSGTDAGGKMKSVSGLWTSPNIGATNSSGFSALPGGFRDTTGNFGYIGDFTNFWSTSEYSATASVRRYLTSSNSNIYRYNDPKNYGFSARCTQD